jgi:type IV secretory pathway TrbL component
VNPTYGGLNTTLATILERINAAGVSVDATLQPVFFTAGVLLLVTACIKFMWQRDLAPLAGFVVQFIMLMGIVTLSARWMPLTEGYMVGMGSYGARIGGFVVDQLSPASVIMRGLTIADKMYTENVSWMRTVFGTTEDTTANIVMLLVCVGTIAMAVLMAVFLMLFYVVMKLASVVALVFLVFLLFEWGRFMAAPGLARFMAYGVQMLVMSMVAGLMFSTLDALKLTDRLTANEAIATLVIVAFFAFLFLNTTNIAKEQISGMPVLSLNEFGNALTKGTMAALSMLPGLGKVAAGALGGMPSMPSFRGGAPGIGSGPPGMGGGPGGAGAGPGRIGSAPASAMRMLSKPTTIDGTWTEAKDLGPKSAQRMLAGQKALPDYSKSLFDYLASVII